MFSFFKKDKPNSNQIFSPVKGEFCLLEDVKDEVFSQKLLGEGFAVKPYENYISSPVAGSISMIFETGHAFGIVGDDGKEFLVHIGLDTVNMKGRGFKVLSKVGERAKIGTPIIQIDRELIVENDLDPIVIVVVTNLEGESINYEQKSNVNRGDLIATISKA